MSSLDTDALLADIVAGEFRVMCNQCVGGMGVVAVGAVALCPGEVTHDSSCSIRIGSKPEPACSVPSVQEMGSVNAGALCHSPSDVESTCGDLLIERAIRRPPSLHSL